MQPEITAEMLGELAARASTLTERLAGGYVATTASGRSARRWDQWRLAAAAGSAPQFERRLAQWGLSEAEARAWLGNVRLGEATPLPAWAGRLPAIVDALCRHAPEQLGEYDGTAPFGHFFVPLGATVADTILKNGSASRLDPAVRGALRDGLIVRLAPAFAPSLYAWFDAFRRSRSPAMPDEGQDVYLAFIAWLRDGRVWRLFTQRPVLARLLATMVGQWEDATTEMLRRLAADANELTARVFDGAPPGRVVGIDFAVADQHANGRSVAILRFESGQRLVYKPKDLGTDVAWTKLLSWIEQAGGPARLFAPVVVARDGYGWSACVDWSPVADAEAVRRFFHQAGAMLGLFHVLGATDFHHENIVASNRGPVAIDTETLLRPQVADEAGGRHQHAARRKAFRTVSESVLSTGYLPKWSEFRGASWATGGLAHTQSTVTSVAGYVARNTNRMRPGPVPPPKGGLNHLPTLDGVLLNPSDYRNEIEAGFRAMSGFIARRREEFEQGPLAAFHRTTVRIVRRETQLYYLLKERMVQPAVLTDGADFSIEIDFLARSVRPESDAAGRQVLAEHAALSRMDVPLFRMPADGTVVTEASGISFDLNSSAGAVISPYLHAVRRVRELNEPEIERQSRYLRTALESHQLRPLRATNWPVNEGATWSATEAIERAVMMGRRIRLDAIAAEDGLAWVGAVAVGRQERTQLDVLGFDLYAGTCGLALFFAALFRVTGDMGFRQDCQGAFSPLRQAMADEGSARDLVRGAGLGGAVGVGSFVYALATCARLTGDGALLADARRLTDLVSPDTIAGATEYDVLGGCAGGILGWLALPDDRRALQLAIACGERLVALFTPWPHGDRFPADQPLLAGFAHGAAGIALALTRLAARADDERFQAAAMQWIEFERRQFHAVEGNWLDLRYQTREHPDPEFFVSNWCHGATGIGLARVAMPRAAWDETTPEEIDAAGERTLQAPMSDLDHLCCGNFGRLEFLLNAGRALNRAEWVNAARQRAAWRLQRTTAGHRWRIATDAENIGLFQGAAGIGYGLLRLARPDLLPSVLTWETGADRTTAPAAVEPAATAYHVPNRS